MSEYLAQVSPGRFTSTINTPIRNKTGNEHKYFISINSVKLSRLCSILVITLTNK